MIKIAECRDKYLEIGEQFDVDEELEMSIYDVFQSEYSVWLNKEEVKLLIEHLQKVIKKDECYISKFEEYPKCHCEFCGSKIKEEGNSLHVWHVEYECGHKIWGAIDTKTHGDTIEISVECPNIN
jgi:hypothetical protein